MKAEKILARMRANPPDWTIHDLKTVAQRNGMTWHQRGTSHVVFRHRTGRLSVPADRPIKPIYVKLFLDLLEGVHGTQA